VSVAQVLLVGLAVLTFAMGWLARGRRERAERAEAHPTPAASELDIALAAALTAFQAAIAVWQLEGQGGSQLADRVLATFTNRSAAVDALLANAELRDQARYPLTQVRAALEHLSSGLEDYREGLVLDADRERALLRAERAFTAARIELLLTSQSAR
jgi:hypothetical protein